MAIKRGMLSGSLVEEEQELNLVRNIDSLNNNSNFYILQLVVVAWFSMFVIYKLLKQLEKINDNQRMTKINELL